MIHYHGLPITPDTAAVAAIGGGHAFVSFAEPRQLELAIEVCQSIAIDNGAFSAWRSGAPIKDWSGYYQFVHGLVRCPSFDFAVIPDVIDGDAAANDDLLARWPWPQAYGIGAPVWHMHEPIDRLARLCREWPRVCLGSSGDFSAIGTQRWWQRMAAAMDGIADDEGQMPCRLHGLRMLDPAIFSRLPLSSADSTNIGRNVGLDSRWASGPYPPAGKAARAAVMRGRIEAVQSPRRWRAPDIAKQFDIFAAPCGGE